MDLTARQYHYGGREASPTHTGDLQSMLLALHQALRHLRAVKDLSLHKGKDTEQTPQSKVSKIIIALTIFFHSLIISHLNSRFPHELKAIFYGNYLVPALVNNVYPQIVNDTKTEHRSDFPYPNDLPQEVDRWVAKCICCNLQFVNTLTDSIPYADTDLNPNVHVILKVI
jgi:hypothetical protein